MARNLLRSTNRANPRRTSRECAARTVPACVARNLLRSMPANPRERNFWKVLEKHREQVPKQTYDYVLYIVAAAVIGENPRLFGFPFDSPLAFLDKQ